jgi:hypothetical protein
VRGAVVGSYRGGVTVRNDDPMPTVSVTPVADRVTEGQPLRWKVTLSRAADVDLEPDFVIRPVTSGPELSTKDVDPQWLESASGANPDPERALSDVGYLFVYPEVPAGELSGEVTLPTVRDQVAEPAESVLFQRTDDNAHPQPGGAMLSGTVLDAP